MNNKTTSSDSQKACGCINAHKDLVKKNFPFTHFLPIFFCFLGGAFGFVIGGTLGNCVLEEQRSILLYILPSYLGATLVGVLGGYLGLHIKNRKIRKHTIHLDDVSKPKE